MGLSFRRQPGDVRADRQLQVRPGPRPLHPAEVGAMNLAMNLAFAPLLPWLVLGPLIALAVLALVAAFAGNGRGRWWRLVLLSGIALALIQPSIVREQRDPVK